MDAHPSDLEPARTLNNAAVPAVNALDADQFAALGALGRLRVAKRDGAVVGFVLTLTPGVRYHSQNYAWFAARFERFRYIDRVVVAPAFAGQGIGRALYADVMAVTRAVGDERIACEVNVVPPNPGSRAFHERLGFRVLTERVNPPEMKRVAMMVRELDG